MPALTKKILQKVKTLQEPVWAGPESDSVNGGVTQSLVSRYLSCSERFRLYTIEGLRAEDTFSHRLQYGNLWHVCEEAHANNTDFQQPLKDYAAKLCGQYRMQQEQVSHWYNVCKTQFPVYVKYWEKHPDVKDRTPIAQELVFNVPYTLPSGRVVRLRGKFDSIDLIGKGKNAAIWLQENKAKGEVDEQQLKRQLSFDLQSMIYIIALQEDFNRGTLLSRIACAAGYGNPASAEEAAKKNGIAGVRYNVIRRPLSGGAGSIRQHKPSKQNPRGESSEEFYDRLRKDVLEPNAAEFFFRWNVNISESDIQEFKRQTLHPVLENLCDDYEWWEACYRTGLDPYDYQTRQDTFPDHRQRHFRMPYIYNVLAEGGSTEYDTYLAEKSEVGLVRSSDTLFRELE